MYARNILPELLGALADTPVVLITGPRQSGKTTLAQSVIAAGHPAAYVTLDHAETLASARRDPDGFVALLPEHAVLDEVHRVPELFLSIKASVDRDRRPGRFILTGSANVVLLPGLLRELVGRVQLLTLHALSQGELRGAREGFVDAVLADQFRPQHTAPASEDPRASLRAALRGGFPEAVARKDDRRRSEWFSAYVSTVLDRDVADIASVEARVELVRLLTLLAGRSGGLLNVADVSRALEIPYTTLRRYLRLLEAVYLLQPLPAWSANVRARLVKAPKTHLCDSGLTGHLLRVGTDDPAAGHVLETFVVGELRKQITWSESRPLLMHFRTHAGREVDVVLEQSPDRVVGIEVKSSVSVSDRDFSGLRELSERLGRRFLRGVVLHPGDQVLPFGERMFAVPLAALWTMGAVPQPARPVASPGVRGARRKSARRGATEMTP